MAVLLTCGSPPATYPLVPTWSFLAVTIHLLRTRHGSLRQRLFKGEELHVKGRQIIKGFWVGVAGLAAGLAAALTAAKSCLYRWGAVLVYLGLISDGMI